MAKSESYIEINPDTGAVIAYVGEAANDLFMMTVLHSALGLAEKGISLGARYGGKTQLLREAETYTGKKYPRGCYRAAREDLVGLINSKRKTIEIRPRA